MRKAIILLSLVILNVHFLLAQKEITQEEAKTFIDQFIELIIMGKLRFQ